MRTEIFPFNGVVSLHGQRSQVVETLHEDVSTGDGTCKEKRQMNHCGNSARKRICELDRVREFRRPYTRNSFLDEICNWVTGKESKVKQDSPSSMNIETRHMVSSTFEGNTEFQASRWIPKEAATKKKA